LVKKGDRDYVIRYTDKDDELINVSDEEDFLTACDIAESELDGNLKFVIDFRKPLCLSDGETPNSNIGKETLKKFIKEAKKEKKERKAKKTLKKKSKKSS